MANRIRAVATACVVLTLGLLTPACGGGGGGAGPGGAGQGLVLVDFLQASIDNVQINTELEFVFSEEVDPSTITPAAIQVREGPDFGAQVPGIFRVEGNKAIFTPNLPGLCDLSDSGLDAGRVYSVQIVGHPEEFAVKNTHGQPLNQTSSWSFTTRPDTDPEKFRDTIPGQAPFVALAVPASGEQAVAVVQGSQLVLTMSENLDPCTVTDSTVSVSMTQTGDPVFANGIAAPNGRVSGFYTGTSTADQDANHSLWGADVSTTLPTPQTLLVDVDLVQNFDATQIVISPQFGEWPDNALIRVDLSFGIEDFGGAPMNPFTMSFTTENLNGSSGQYNMLFEGETPFLISSTADVNTARAPGAAQGFLLITGDGDNGGNQLAPSRPLPSGGCVADPSQVNNGVLDNFDPGADVVLDSGPANDCANLVDGSTGVVWEFASFLIRNGITVRLVGENPAIILVQGDATIEAGARLVAQGDGSAGTPDARGTNGDGVYNNTQRDAADGGVGASGSGSGGSSFTIGSGSGGEDGIEGFGSPEGFGAVGGTGSGKGNVNATATGFNTGGGSPGGGGAGHSEPGEDGGLQTGSATHPTSIGFGGGTYPGGASADRLLTPSAGSGGGAAGWTDFTQSSYIGYDASGGAGGAGGGFIDITATGDINIFGLIDARGGRGGTGGGPAFYSTSGGGGGGSGGGVRLLTPNDINVSGGSITAAGGAGGPGAAPQGNAFLSGPGGAGGPGRIALEDGDSSITGLETAVIVPLEGADGFYRGVFDATRFSGGGAVTIATSDIFLAGPLNPAYTTPIQSDFVAAMPAVSAGSIGDTGMLVEVRGYNLLPDGTADLGSVTSYFSIGHFQNSGSENAPAWNLGHPAGLPRGDGNTSNAGTDNMASLDGLEFLQVRITFVMNGTVGVFDPGPSIDNWAIRFGFDN